MLKRHPTPAKPSLPTSLLALRCHALVSWLHTHQRLARSAFILYAIVLVTLTHWPSLAIAKPFEIRLDLFIHMGVFAGWTLLFIASAWLGPLGSITTVVRSTITALIYALVDELTQGIPILHRTVDPMDYIANATGILIIGTACCVLLWKYPFLRKGNPA